MVVGKVSIRLLMDRILLALDMMHFHNLKKSVLTLKAENVWLYLKQLSSSSCSVKEQSEHCNLTWNLPGCMLYVERYILFHTGK